MKADKDWKHPDKNCTFLGVMDDGKILCDSTGGAVSPEFCLYCQYWCRMGTTKPYEFADKFSSFLMKLCEEEDKR